MVSLCFYGHKRCATGIGVSGVVLSLDKRLKTGCSWAKLLSLLSIFYGASVIISFILMNKIPLIRSACLQILCAVPLSSALLFADNNTFFLCRTDYFLIAFTIQRQYFEAVFFRSYRSRFGVCNIR